MSSRNNRRKRRQNNEMPVLIERIKKAEQNYEQSAEGAWKGRPRTGNYEIDNWPWLSPEFRAAHNRRLQARGEPTIPPPAVDLYVAPPPRLISSVIKDAEVVNTAREIGAVERRIMIGGGDEGFTINGREVKL